LCNLTLTQRLYGEHPYGVVATEASINSIDRADVSTFHRTYLVRARALITLVGDLSREQAVALAERLSAALPVAKGAIGNQPAQLSSILAVEVTSEVTAEVTSEETSGAISGVTSDTGEGMYDAATIGSNKQNTKVADKRANPIAWIEHPASQAHIALGALVPGVGDPEYFPLMVANRMFSWRLNDVVRDKLGLAYEVSSALFMSRLGEHRIALKTRSDQAERTLAAVSETLRGFTVDSIDVAEFSRTQAELIQGRPLAFDSNAKLLRHASDMAFDGLPADYLQTWSGHVGAVTLAQAVEVFRKWIRPERQVTVVVGGEKGHRPG